jgi:hypothetical protein
VPRDLSSNVDTILTKFLGWIFAIFALVLWLYVIPRQPAPISKGGLIFTAVWTVFALYMSFGWFRLQKVQLDANDLIISRSRREIRVPLNQVVAVSGGAGGKSTIRIDFRIDTDFGQSVEFLPYTRVMWPWKCHPLVQELRDLANLTAET